MNQIGVFPVDRTLPTWAGVLVAAVATSIAGAGLVTGEPKAAVVLPLGAIALIGMALLSAVRFDLFVAAILVIRPTLDALATGTERTNLDPAAVVALLFVVAGCVWLAIQRSEYPLESPSPLVRPMAAFLAAGAVSVVLSSDWVRSLTELMRLATVAVMLMVFHRLLADREKLVLVLKALFASALIPLFVGFYQAITSQGVRLDPFAIWGTGAFERVSGTFLHPNPFAAYLAVLITLGVAIFRYLPARARIAMMIFLPACAVLLLLSYSRGAWIAAVAGLLTVGFLEGRRLLAVVAVVIIAVVIAVPTVRTRFADLSQERRPSGATGNSLVWRVQYWDETLSLAADRPVLGIGPGMVQATTSEGKSPHNDFLRVYVETGVLGLAAYLWLLVSLFVVARRAVRRAAGGLDRGIAVGFAGSLVAFLLISVVDNVISQLVILWYFGTVAAAAAVVAERGRIPARGAP